jgi:hypothetical protein
VTTGRGGNNLLRTAQQAVTNTVRSAATSAVGRRSPQAAIAYETLKARPTAAGTISANDPGTARRIAAAQKSGKEWEKQERRARERNSTRRGTSFEDAFKDARQAKVKTFTWKGKRYTTEMAK